jgi:hypothetical protein
LRKALILRLHFFQPSIHIAEKTRDDRRRHSQMRGFFSRILLIKAASLRPAKSYVIGFYFQARKPD